jgi:hypothetical protein
MEGSTAGGRARACSAGSCNGVSLRVTDCRARVFVSAGGSAAEARAGTGGLARTGDDAFARVATVRLAPLGNTLPDRSGLPGATFVDSAAAGWSGSVGVFDTTRRGAARGRGNGGGLPTPSSTTFLRAAVLRGAGGESGALVAGERGRLRGGSFGGWGVSLMRTV